MDRSECVIVGGGIVGLAIARCLALAGREVVVVERAEAVGTETSARSNEVIHAGILYRPGGPQARLCPVGARALYGYCASRGVPHRRIGKLLIATAEDEIDWLAAMRARAVENGVDDLEWLDGEAAAGLEPAIRCSAGLLSPSSGIVDTHALMLAYQGEAEARGAVVALNSEVVAGAVADTGFELEVRDAAGETTRLGADILVNAAGIWATPLARRIGGMPAELIPEIHLAKGAFFTLAGRTPFSRLIIPPHQWMRRGCHYTLDLAMAGRFGPDEEWVDTVDYAIDPARVAHFYDGIRRYYPGLADGALQPGYTGIRPRLNGPGEEMADWILQGPAEHGIARLVNLFGIESPGITASLGLGETVAAMLAGEPFGAALGAAVDKLTGAAPV